MTCIADISLFIHEQHSVLRCVRLVTLGTRNELQIVGAAVPGQVDLGLVATQANFVLLGHRGRSLRAKIFDWRTLLTTANPPHGMRCPVS